MFISKINPTTQQSFGALKPDSAMPKEVFEAIKQAPALKKFAKDFDAYISVGSYTSAKNPAKVRYSLHLSDVKPVSLMERAKKLLGFGKSSREMVLKTHAQNTDDFVKSINSKPENALYKLEHEGF